MSILSRCCYQNNLSILSEFYGMKQAETNPGSSIMGKNIPMWSVKMFTSASVCVYIYIYICVCMCVCVCVRVCVSACVFESECTVSRDFLPRSFYFWQPIRGISGRQLWTISRSYEYQSDLWLQLHFHSQVTNNLKREGGKGRRERGREGRSIHAEKLETQEFETTKKLSSSSKTLTRYTLSVFLILTNRHKHIHTEYFNLNICFIFRALP